MPKRSKLRLKFINFCGFYYWLLTAEKDTLSQHIAQLKLEAEARQAEANHLLASVSSQDGLVAQLDAKVVEIEKARADIEGDTGPTGIILDPLR